MEVSQATPEDAEGIHRLIHNGWLTFANEEKGPTADEVESFFKSILTPESLAETIRLGVNKYFVAKKNGKLVGVISWREDKDSVRPANFHAPDARAAMALIHAARRNLDPKKDWVLSVVEHNLHAIELYEKLGFTRSERKPWTEEWTTPDGNKGHRPMIKMVKKAEPVS